MANLTLLDWAKRLDPDGTVPYICNLLAQTNEILTDMVAIEGNLPTGHRTTIATGLPTTYFRAINQGIATSKGTTVQVDEGMAMAEARSEVDPKLAKLNGNTAAFRLSEARLFIESMNQKIATTMFYGNPAVDPKEFLGLTQRFSDLTAANAQNIINGAGATASQQTSIWLVCWGEQSTFTFFPKGSKAGLSQRDLGEMTSFDAGGAGLRMQVLAELFQWDIGLCVKDWRSVVRIVNVDTADFTALGNELAPSVFTNIIHLMSRAVAKVPPSIMAMSRPAFYMNASSFSCLMRTALEKSSSVLRVNDALDQFGRPGRMLSFLGIPIRQCDAILNTEAVLS